MADPSSHFPVRIMEVNNGMEMTPMVTSATANDMMKQFVTVRRLLSTVMDAITSRLPNAVARLSKVSIAAVSANCNELCCIVSSLLTLLAFANETFSKF